MLPLQNHVILHHYSPYVHCKNICDTCIHLSEYFTLCEYFCEMYFLFYSQIIHLWCTMIYLLTEWLELTQFKSLWKPVFRECRGLLCGVLRCWNKSCGIVTCCHDTKIIALIRYQVGNCDFNTFSILFLDKEKHSRITLLCFILEPGQHINHITQCYRGLEIGNMIVIYIGHLSVGTTVYMPRS